VEALKDKHRGQPVWIIGKGPSLANLKASDIGDGVVIALNEAILAIEPLGLSNPVYSMQKDGGKRKRPSPDNLCPDCDHSDDCGSGCGDMVQPKNSALILHDLESKYCFPDYQERHVLNLQELGLPGNVFSLIFAVRTAQYMGCNQFNFVSCDAHANGNVSVFVPGLGIAGKDDLYRGQVEKLPYFTRGLDCRFITPGVLKVSIGCITNDVYRLNTVLKKSSLPGELHYIHNPESATKGLNKLLDIIEAEGADIAVLTHQDMYYRQGWLAMLQGQLAQLPESWVCAGIIGKDMEGRLCGKIHDMRIVDNINTDFIHTFPHEACCFDECTIIYHHSLSGPFRPGERFRAMTPPVVMALWVTFRFPLAPSSRLSPGPQN